MEPWLQIKLSYHIKDSNENEDISDAIINPITPTLIIQETVIAPELIEIGATNTPFLKLELIAREGDINLNTLGILITGTITNSEVTGVKLFYDKDSNNEFSESDTVQFSILT